MSTVIPVRDPDRPERFETKRCEGDHFFEEVCNDCGAAKPNASCSVCPHMPGSSPTEHYVRRPCLQCGGHNLRTVRVRHPPLTMAEIDAALGAAGAAIDDDATYRTKGGLVVWDDDRVGRMLRREPLLARAVLEQAEMVRRIITVERGTELGLLRDEHVKLRAGECLGVVNHTDIKCQRDCYCSIGCQTRDLDGTRGDLSRTLIPEQLCDLVVAARAFFRPGCKLGTPHGCACDACVNALERLRAAVQKLGSVEREQCSQCGEVIEGFHSCTGVPE